MAEEMIQPGSDDPMAKRDIEKFNEGQEDVELQEEKPKEKVLEVGGIMKMEDSRSPMADSNSWWRMDSSRNGVVTFTEVTGSLNDSGKVEMSPFPRYDGKGSKYERRISIPQTAIDEELNSGNYKIL